ncbi:hypothetical protein AVEN_185022-1 [Araneus ventricosus]|uniref:Uncharacterized protein n=1 Tax=Araneus ventricosus TaxID=182803 RepID=A0A4Y2BPB9_ARAVE|nr:hypothetical protein AVEN_185022-1 [Araneus ventricosus]
MSGVDFFCEMNEQLDWKSLVQDGRRKDAGTWCWRVVPSPYGQNFKKVIIHSKRLPVGHHRSLQNNTDGCTPGDSGDHISAPPITAGCQNNRIVQTPHLTYFPKFRCSQRIGIERLFWFSQDTALFLHIYTDFI